MFKIIENYNELRKEFEELDRGNQFSPEGFRVLFNLITELEDSTGEELELDVIALCSQFSELTKKDLLEDYNLTFEDLEDLGAIYAVGERLKDNGKTEEFVILYVENF